MITGHNADSDFRMVFLEKTFYLLFGVMTGWSTSGLHSIIEFVTSRTAESDVPCQK